MKGIRKKYLGRETTLVPEALREAKETRGENEEHLVTSIANPTFESRASEWL
jgi:hypothetical protein